MPEAAALALTVPTRVWSRTEVLTRPGPVPKSPGAYAWYFRSPPAAVPLHGCTRHDKLVLLYVGISPKQPPRDGRPGSRQTLASRIRGRRQCLIASAPAFGSYVECCDGCSNSGRAVHRRGRLSIRLSHRSQLPVADLSQAGLMVRLLAGAAQARATGTGTHAAAAPPSRARGARAAGRQRRAHGRVSRGVTRYRALRSGFFFSRATRAIVSNA